MRRYKQLAIPLAFAAGLAIHGGAAANVEAAPGSRADLERCAAFFRVMSENATRLGGDTEESRQLGLMYRNQSELLATTADVERLKTDDTEPPALERHYTRLSAELEQALAPDTPAGEARQWVSGRIDACDVAMRAAAD
jgi:hypothetical protein